MLETWAKGRNLAEAMALHVHVCMWVYAVLLRCFCFAFVGGGSRIHVPRHHVLNRQLLQDQNYWNSLIKSYSKQGRYRRSLDLYEEMQKDDSLRPSTHSFVALLKACAKLKDVKRGCQVHTHISRQGLMGKDTFIGATLVDMYAKCGSFSKAQDVFYMLPTRNAVSGTALMTGYVENGFGEEALICFEQMKAEGIYLDAVTFVCAVRACGHIRSPDKGREVHTELTSKGLERDLVAGSALIDFYTKCSFLAEGREVFDTLSAQDAVSWTALIAGYVESGYDEDALDLFKRMQHEGCAPDAATCVCCLKACGSLGVIERGIEVHAETIRRDLGGNFMVGSTLVNMYAKCGLLAKAQEAFDKLSTRDVISWTALLMGYTQCGKSNDVFDVFCMMIEEGIQPNLATFRSVLNACCHAGLVNKGTYCFHTMIRDYDLVPSTDHFTCVADLLSRAGRIDGAFALIEQMPCHPVTATWHVVLGACRNVSNLELGQHAFQHAVHMDEHDASSYVCMYNIYADVWFKQG